MGITGLQEDDEEWKIRQRRWWPDERKSPGPP